jgi:hypothetical protein
MSEKPVIRVLVCGGRNNNRAEVRRSLEAYHQENPALKTVIHGGGGNTDLAAHEWAKEKGLEIERYNAEWDKYGVAAGPIRNGQMLIVGKPDLVIAYAGGRGTADMKRRAVAANVPVRER